MFLLSGQHYINSYQVSLGWVHNGFRMNLSLKQDYISDPSFDYGQQNATIEGILKKEKRNIIFEIFNL